MLIGREWEGERIDAVLSAAQAGRATSLVLVGEAGIGKTALLDHAAGQAGRRQVAVIRVQGIESEAEVAFAGLLSACRPLLEHLDALAEPQADALRGALGLTAQVGAPVGGRLIVAAATLSLLASAAETRPLLLLIDDAHWLDAPSADALLFAAKRLEADAVGIVFAARMLDGAGLEEVHIGGLELG